MLENSATNFLAPAAHRSEPPPAHDPDAPSALDDIPCPAAILDVDGVVTQTNAAWQQGPGEPIAPGQTYLNALRVLVPHHAAALGALARALALPADDVTEQTLECHNDDSEHWFTVSISTVVTGGRLGWLVLHQDATALQQQSRRLRLTRRLAAVQAAAHDPAVRARRLAATIGDQLEAAAVVLWERAPSGVLRARPLATVRPAAQIASIAHTRQIVRVMEGQSAQWIALLDGTACFAVPLVAGEQVILFHFGRRPRFDAETLRTATRALQADGARGPARATRGRSPRQVRRQLGQQGPAASPSLAAQERQHIERTLAGCGHNVLRTARALGIARSTLYERFKDYGIAVPPRTR